MSKIQISRDSCYADKARSYKIICNSVCLGKISNGQTVTLDIAPEDYEIFLKIDWCRSNKIRLSVPEGELVAIQAGSNVRGIRLFLIIFYVILLPHKYLWLRNDNG